MFAVAKPIDLLTVKRQLEEAGKLEMVGGPGYLMKLTSFVNSAANIEHHAQVIIEQALRREVISISYIARKSAFDDTADILETIDQFNQKIFELMATGTQRRILRGSEVAYELLKNLEAEIANPQLIQRISVPSGLYHLDNITGGFENATLTILAARPAMGKSAFALNLALNAAQLFGEAVAFFALEMSSRDVTYRFLSMLSGIESKRIKTRQLSKEEAEKVRIAEADLSRLHIYIDDTPSLSILELRSKARRLLLTSNIRVILIDYLQLMKAVTTSSPGKTNQNREQEIATIARALKELAKEMDVPVIALSQINRAVENRQGNKRPQLSDLRESGEIEQSGDLIIFLYRDDYYGNTEDAYGNPTKGITEVILAKHRDGSLGTVYLRFVAACQRFENLKEEHPLISNMVGELLPLDDDFTAYEPPTQVKSHALPLPSLPVRFSGFTKNPDDFENTNEEGEEESEENKKKDNND